MIAYADRRPDKAFTLIR
ncbi:TPA: hypothetical protein ACPT1G_004202 [Escherichia coli]|nr:MULTISPECIES: hypothetical protein [Enterobacteriaceae]MCF7259261.1 hypothetical protein [Escherichia coli]MCG9433930.1 hypothetical protein [Escherichia coli]MCL0934653.1 hypothetical protein [Escherichia coli]MCM2713493.1 hypothetical protein [Escherichia coli]MCN3521916.1 hypothetical protein [Escherichia coli]